MAFPVLPLASSELWNLHIGVEIDIILQKPGLDLGKFADIADGQGMKKVDFKWIIGG